MGCSAVSRLINELKQNQEELTNQKLLLKKSSELRQAIDCQLSKSNNTASILANHNEKLNQDLSIKTGLLEAVDATMESERDEQEGFRDWIELEIREGNMVMSTIVMLHGADETGQVSKQLKTQMERLEESEYSVEKLKEFSQWEFKQIRTDVEGLMDSRVSWMQFIQELEDDIKDSIEQIDRESGGRVRPLLSEIRAKLGRLPSASQLLSRFRALQEVDRSLLSLRASGEGDTDKFQDTKQAEEIKVMTQRLAELRKAEDQRRPAFEKDLSLKEVHIKHLENKVKDLSRPSVADNEMKAKDRDIDRIRVEITKAREDQRSCEEQLETAQRHKEELTEKHTVLDQELATLRE